MLRQGYSLCLLYLCIAVLPLRLGAQQNEDVAESRPSPLTELGGEYHNSIKLLQNRFRIDYKVDEITLVFFREFGSAPVVLVRPDGSKIFQSQADEQDIFWYDSNTYDMINIKNPTPGPWQAVGQILPNSRVMVLSDIVLHAEPLPSMIFSGEILKQTAYLTNGEEPINYSQFRDVVTLSIELASSNNPNFDNFGASSEIVATFEDNGLGMDEAPLDGTFTGQFNLAIAAGEWRPLFRVTTPMFTREQVGEPLILHPNPIRIDVEKDGGGEGYHKLLIDAERELVDMSSLLIDGKVRFPNGDIQNFSLTELSADTREHLVVNYEYGVFRVKVTAYGKTVDGRDFILDVPEYTFATTEPEPEPVATGVDDGTSSESTDGMTQRAQGPTHSMNADAQTVMKQPSANADESPDLLFWIVVVNGSIIGVGIIVAGVVVLLKRQKTASGLSPNNLELNSLEDAQKKGVFARLISRLPFKK
ncbi:TIGR03503 family protein [Alteromonas oceanisediminis]|uniref:TIGR03503 family protein n=1 Tax=Alteromonas oceanisediminis TaxID=2836180 RepID=UPI001BD958C8|nr:TIGR03503 family protein [Alteromonas oceanisediminis]MBT0587221.1 TIGR03503 family protein [Alteromonas oceanisediminis]